MTSISAVLPAYNEEALIGSTASSVASVLSRLTDDYEVIIVDDGSADSTRAICESLAQENPRLRCESHAANRGYGEALRTGFDTAAKDWIFLTDGDGQFDPAQVEEFLPLLEQADLIIGYRAPRRDPWPRRLFGWGWFLAVTLLFGYTARDIDCAFKLIRRRVWKSLEVECGGATFSAELLAKARRHQCRIIELPVKHRPRLAGQPTGASPRVILRAFRELLWLRLHFKSAVHS